MVYLDPRPPVDYIVPIIGPAGVIDVDDNRSVTGHGFNSLAVDCLQLPGLPLLLISLVVIIISGFGKRGDLGLGVGRVCVGIGLTAVPIE